MARQAQPLIESASTARRHSCAVTNWSQGHKKEEGLRRSSLRRNSLADNLDSLTRSMSAKLSLVHRRSSFSSSLDFGDFKLTVDKNIVQAALCRRYQDQTIKVSKLKVKRPSSNESSFELEVWTKGILRMSGRRRIDLIARIVEEGEEDRENEVYRTLLADIRKYLSEKHSINSKCLPIPMYFKVENSDFQEDSKLPMHSDKPIVFMIEDVRNIGFNKDPVLCREGLDYEHSILAVASLARLHASSYCYRKEKKVDMKDAYPVIENDVSMPNISDETVLLIEEILQQTAGYEKYSKLFLAVTKEELVGLKDKLDWFGVLCHGQLFGENILFKYKKQLDSTLCCLDAIFLDLKKCHYGSCVLDLLQVIFSSINIDVRQSFLADIVCSVYYDNFAKAVSSINTNITIFTKKQFIKEFDRNIMYGFLFALNNLSNSYLTGVDNDLNGERFEPSLIKFRVYFLALVRDILQFKVNAKATVN